VCGNTGKLIRAIGVYAMSPSLLPYYLIFWPGALPSTFDLPKHQEAKYLSHVAARVDGLLQGLSPVQPLVALLFCVRALLQQCVLACSHAGVLACWRARDTCATGLMELERESTSEKNPVQAKEALALKTAGLKALSRSQVCQEGQVCASSVPNCVHKPPPKPWRSVRVQSLHGGLMLGMPTYRDPAIMGISPYNDTTQQHNTQRHTSTTHRDTTHRDTLY
jgi:hypothetical protein